MNEDERLYNIIIRGVDNIMFQRTMIEILNQWLNDRKSVLLKYNVMEYKKVQFILNNKT